MSLPTQMSLHGFIATVPDLTFTRTGTARFYARVGCEHYRKEVDGGFTKLDPTFHDPTVVREEFVARRIGHDTARTPYDVQRRRGTSPDQVAEQAPQPAVGL
jgi:single-strand DNA-binding protein